MSTRRERVESPTFGAGWLIWPGPEEGMRFTFEADWEGGTFSVPVCFTMDVSRGVLSASSPRHLRDSDLAEAKARGVEAYARYDQQIDEDSDEEPRIEAFTEDHFREEVDPDPEGEQWFTLVTGDREVFGFRRLPGA